MTNQSEIPAEMLDAATKAILSKQGNQPETCLELKDSPYAVERSEYWTAREKAQAALEAANVAALLAERDGLAKDKQILTTALIQQSERITELEAELSRHQESQFHPDWRLLEATRESLREAWAKLKEMEQTAADALKEAE